MDIETTRLTSGRTGLALAVAGAAWLAGVLGPAGSARAGEKDAFEAVGELVRKAKQGPLRERLPAIDSLGRGQQREVLREWDVVGTLVGLARDVDENPRIQRAAVKALGALFLGVDRSIKSEIREPMVKVLIDTKAHVIVRREVATQFGRMCTAKEFGDVSMVNGLLGAARTSTTNPPEVVEAAMIALGRVGDPKACKVILENLSHREDSVRDAAIEAMSQALKGEHAESFLKDPNLQRKLNTLLTDPKISPGARHKVLEVVGDVLRGGRKFPGADTALLKVLREEKLASAVKSALRAVSAIGSTKVASVLPDVYERFGAESDIEGADEVRVEVCAAAGELFVTWTKKKTGVSMASVKALVDLLTDKAVNDQESSVAKEAVVQLGNLYGRRFNKTNAVAMLIVLLSEEGTSDELKSAARESLEVLTGRSFKTVKEWENYFQRNKAKLRGSSG